VKVFCLHSDWMVQVAARLLMEVDSCACKRHTIDSPCHQAAITGQVQHKYHLLAWAAERHSESTTATVLLCSTVQCYAAHI